MKSMAAFDPRPNGAPSAVSHTESHDYFPPHIDEEYDRPISPLQMPPSQIDGLESLQAESFLKGQGQPPARRGSGNSSLLHLDIPRFPPPAELAISAMQYLPYPLLVLSSLKTLVMANEALGRLLGIEDDDGDSVSDDGISGVERLRGQTLSQLGIDMLQDGRPVWVTWDSFLDSLADGLGTHMSPESEFSEGDVTPTAERAEHSSRRSSANKNRSTAHDSVVEVIISSENISPSCFARSDQRPTGKHVFAKMIISVWEIEEERFFTMTFTSTDTNQASLPSSRGTSRQVVRAAKHTSSRSGTQSSPSSVSSGRSSNRGGSSNSSAITSPTNTSMSSSPFPPLGPPTRTTLSNAPSSLQKVIMMKDALLDNTQVPILAMWKDESLTIPNRAARRLFHPSADLTVVKDGFDLVSKWHVWDETFTTKLDPSEYPISVLVRTQTPFEHRKIGIYDPETDRRIVFDCLGEALMDEHSGEFLAGVLTCRDITSMTEQINEIKEKDEQRFELICDSMPQMIWTTTPEGMHDWFSQRWLVIPRCEMFSTNVTRYEYTGLTEEQSLGMGWQLPFHPDDMPATGKRWQHSLKTGDPYSTEYRCRAKNGEWRWMLGRALPLRNKQTGAIEKWFGTCTDIHEGVESRFAAKRMASLSLVGARGTEADCVL
jgi:PAS domain S-box-containing protein